MKLQFFGALLVIAPAAMLPADAANCPERIPTEYPNHYLTVENVPGRGLMVKDYLDGRNTDQEAIQSWLEMKGRYVADCDRVGWRNTSIPGNICLSADQAVRQRQIEAVKCHASKGADKDDSEIDTVTPPVPGCPKYLRKSMVQWRQTGNPQLNIWEIRNTSNKILKITYRDDGTNSSPDTLNPGQSVQVSLVGRSVPGYVVRDFNELASFNSANAANDKPLKCALAIRPR